jgi:PAS domain-containing protein
MTDVGARHDDRAAQWLEPARSAWAPSELSQSHAVIATLADSIREGLWIVDADGQVLLVNPVAERLLGWTSPELLGTLVHDRVHVHQTGATRHRPLGARLSLVSLAGRPPAPDRA